MRCVKYGGHRRLGVDDQWRVAKWKAHPYVWRLRRRKNWLISRFKRVANVMQHKNWTEENLDKLWLTAGRKLKECVDKSWGPACSRLAATGFAFGGQSTNASLLIHVFSALPSRKKTFSLVKHTFRQLKNNSSLNRIPVWPSNRSCETVPKSYVNQLFGQT